MQQLKPSEISELIRSRIQSLALSADIRTQGTVVSVTDGICRIHGLSDAMQGEMLEFPRNTFGLALNLERDSVGAVILGEYEHITEGDTVKCTGKILSVPVGPELLGRVAGRTLRATTDLAAEVPDSDVVLIAVGTPFHGSRIDLAAIEAASAAIGLTPASGIAPCAMRPRAVTRAHTTPRCSRHSSFCSGSQMMAAVSSRPSGVRARCLAPSMSPSSSTRAPTTSRPWRRAPLRFSAAAAIMAAARPLFMSAAPRP